MMSPATAGRQVIRPRHRRHRVAVAAAAEGPADGRAAVGRLLSAETPSQLVWAICISNKTVTWSVVHGLEQRGIPAFGPVRDS